MQNPTSSILMQQSMPFYYHWLKLRNWTCWHWKAKSN